MPCNMMEGATSGDFALSETNDLRKRVAALEEALCGLCQMMDEIQMHPQLRHWFQDHKRKPGCSA